MMEFLAMGGHGFFVWGAFGATALVIAVEILAVRARTRAAVDAARSNLPDAEAARALSTAGRAG